MKIGVAKEIKKDEYRVAMVPAGVDALVRNGHQVFVEKGAGDGCDLGESHNRRSDRRSPISF